MTTVALVNPPTRGIFALLPRQDTHPAAPLLLRQLRSLVHRWEDARTSRPG